MQMINLNELICGTFDFEREDQPSEISGFDGLIKFIWLHCAINNKEKEMYNRIQQILDSDEELEQIINFSFCLESMILESYWCIQRIFMIKFFCLKEIS